MTESEVINELIDYVAENDKISLSFKVATMAREAIEEVQRYRAIGTVEELQTIKQWKSDVIEDFCKYDVSSFEELIRNSRNKAIDEFAKEIRDWQIDIQDNEYDADKFDFVFERIFEIAEEIKVVD